MGIFSWLFGRKPEPTLQQATAYRAPTVGRPQARTISYKPELVSNLKRDHADLVALYQRLGEMQTAGRFDDIRGELLNFKTRFEAHILTENVQFYTYLEQSLTDDPHNMELIRDFRREMNTIARGVVEFVKKYQSTAFNDAVRGEFAKDYDAVGGLLAQRIGREESQLYPLYEQ